MSSIVPFSVQSSLNCFQSSLMLSRWNTSYMTIVPNYPLNVLFIFQSSLIVPFNDQSSLKSFKCPFPSWLRPIIFNHVFLATAARSWAVLWWVGRGWPFLPHISLLWFFHLGCTSWLPLEEPESLLETKADCLLVVRPSCASSDGKGAFIGDRARWIVISQMDWVMLGEPLVGLRHADWYTSLSDLFH